MTDPVPTKPIRRRGRTVQEQRRHVKRILLRRNRYQFGQPRHTTTLATNIVPGDVACADTCIQMVALIIKGKRYTINQVRRASGNPHHVPMSVVHAAQALRKLVGPYRLRSDLSAQELLVIARTRGPVLIAEDYWAHPQWQGYRYGGMKPMDGRDRNAVNQKVWVGFSEPLRRSGKNQPTFRGGHMVLLATSIDTPSNDDEGFVRDPNHNSSARPERPAWDRVSVGQLRRMMRSFNRGRGIIAIVPDKKLWR